ncbi:MAG: DUF2116 family Zn-ribbon domain-containing protein [Candidatus Marinimicrobia bacterium]|nr:DUF2116 family Zn-ribbon domain-containing protein [Candidatus Neomarinimicrobiota bacterium]
MATKSCPFCAEQIDENAIKCKHCGEFLTKDAKKESRKGSRGGLMTTLIVLAIIALLLALFGF